MAKVSLLNPLAVLVDLEKRARSAITPEELQFIIVNETHNLSPYRQAILFDRFGKIIAISGVAILEEAAPFTNWVNENISEIVRSNENPTVINEEILAKEKRSEWLDWFPKFGILLPLFSSVHGKLGCLLLLRDKNWSNDEKEMFAIMAGAYGHCMGIFNKKEMLAPIRNKSFFLKIIIIFGLVCLSFLPVSLTVLAPSEIVAINPSVIRAPAKGIVERILVKPNQLIKKGDPLFEMDSLSQINDLAVAKKILISLKTQHEQFLRQALTDLNSKRVLMKILGKIKEQVIRIENLKELIQRMKVLAPSDGTVIIDDPSAWLGRPVNLGERILSLANQELVEVESWLSVSDVIDLPEEAQILVYLNSDPLNPILAKLYSFSYEAQLRPGDTFAHRIRARIVSKKKIPRLGLRGIARISGKNVPLLYWILRRPIIALRQFVGF